MVSPSDEMFNHPLATLAAANKHLEAIGETPLTKRKLQSIQYRQKLETVTALMQKEVLDDIQELSDDR